MTSFVPTPGVFIVSGFCRDSVKSVITRLTVGLDASILHAVTDEKSSLAVMKQIAPFQSPKADVSANEVRAVVIVEFPYWNVTEDDWLSYMISHYAYHRVMIIVTVFNIAEIPCEVTTHSTHFVLANHRKVFSRNEADVIVLHMKTHKFEFLEPCECMLFM